MVSSTSNDDEENNDVYVDITHIMQHCVAENLSFSHPFTPLVPPCSIEGSEGHDAPSSNNDKDHADEGPSKKGSEFATLDMREAMTALELGDERMDCCELPITGAEKLDCEGDEALRTIPPRIAPLHLSEGTMTSLLNTSPTSTTPTHSLNHNAPLQLQSSPCPSLLPYWDTISISSSSHQILPLLLLQLTCLEAYIGTNNGGSNAAETLYCMLWCHDGVLKDMCDKLSAAEEANINFLSTLGETTVAQWVLFTSSLGIVRIAEAVRWAVVNADIYEEEDFGVAMHGTDVADINIGDKDGDDPSPSHSTMTFCPLLKKERQSGPSVPTYQADEYIESVWDKAQKLLREFGSSRMSTNGYNDDTIRALEIILHLQQTFYNSICRLSELNDQNVTNFTDQAKTNSRKTVTLLHELNTCNAVVSTKALSNLVYTDGRLRLMGDTEMDSLLHVSFDPFVNRRLLGNAPVRKARFCSTNEVIDSLSRVVSELEWAVCDILLEGNTLGRITRMLENSCARGYGGVIPRSSDNEHDPPFGNQGLAIDNPVGINILSRSLMLLNLYFDDKLLGQYDFPDMIGQHMQQVCAVPDLLLESAYPGCGHSWLVRLAKPIYDTLKALCFDQHRERTFTEAFIFPAFASLQLQAREVDESFRLEHGFESQKVASYASNYVIVQTIRLMERHVGIGISIGLYPKWYDLSTAYWYRDFLLSALLNIRGSIEQERMERKAMELRIKLEEEERKKVNATAKKQIIKKGKKKGKKKDPNVDMVRDSAIKAAARVTAEDFEERVEYTSLTIRRYLCRGTVRYIAALRQAGLLTEPPLSITMFTSHQRRFEKRFESFTILPQPQPLSFEDYLRGSDFSAVRNDDLVQSAGDCFRSCKGVIEKLMQAVIARNDDFYVSIRREEAIALTKVCVANSLFLHKLSIAPPSKVSEVSVEFNAHKEYCTLNLK